MKQPKPIIYEPHPVTSERKAALKAQGYRIIDARFRPADMPEPEPRKRRQRMARTPEDAQPVEPMTETVPEQNLDHDVSAE